MSEYEDFLINLKELCDKLLDKYHKYTNILEFREQYDSDNLPHEFSDTVLKSLYNDLKTTHDDIGGYIKLCKLNEFDRIN